MAKKVNVDVTPKENGKDSSGKEKMKLLKDYQEEGMGRKNKEQRVRIISFL